MNKEFLLPLFAGILIGLLMSPVFTHLANWSSDPHTSHTMANLAGPEMDVVQHDQDRELHQRDSVARNMQGVRVLCWIMTGPKNHEKAQVVKNTWGKRCNVLLFMSSAEDADLPAVVLPVSEGRQNLWGKTKEAFKYVYKNYLDQADWFLKADDDTYVIVENLRYMLETHNSSQAIYFGCRFKKYVKQGYMSGGAGYVLSKEAVKRFIEVAVENKTLCRSDARGSEDLEIGKCLENVNVEAGDSRDSLGRVRFFPLAIEHHLIPGFSKKGLWYWDYMYYPSVKGMDCCSDRPVSFHYVDPAKMYFLEYLIYHLRHNGITYDKVNEDTSEGRTATL